MVWKLEDLHDGNRITLWINAQPLNFDRIDKWKIEMILKKRRAEKKLWKNTLT